VSAAFLVALGAASAGPAQALGVAGMGGQLLAEGGDIAVVFLDSHADYRNSLILRGPDAASFQTIFDFGVAPNSSTNRGIMEGELVFGIKVDEDGDGVADTQYYMGGPDRNVDSEVHADVVQVSDNQYHVRFEDIWHLGDSDYNDYVILVTIRSAPVDERVSPAQVEVPQPRPVVLVGLGLLLVGGLTLRKRHRAQVAYRCWDGRRFALHAACAALWDLTGSAS
jgi:hypothetical protein